MNMNKNLQELLDWLNPNPRSTRWGMYPHLLPITNAGPHDPAPLIQPHDNYNPNPMNLTLTLTPWMYRTIPIDPAPWTLEEHMRGIYQTLEDLHMNIDGRWFEGRGTCRRRLLIM